MWEVDKIPTGPGLVKRHGRLDVNTESPTFETTVSAHAPKAHAASHADGGSDEITVTQAQVTNLTTDLAAKAPLASPTFTGIPAAPTAGLGTNTTQIATTAFVKGAVDALIASAPGALDTLDELAAALGDDANFAGTVTTALAGKAPLASPTFTGQVTAPAGSAGTPGVTFTGATTDTGLYSPGADQVGIATAGTAAVIVDASGRLGVGNVGTMSGGAAIQLIGGDNAPAGTMRVRRISASANPSTLSIEKARGTLPSSPASVNASDGIGIINFLAHDGTAYLTAATIAATVDGTPGTNDMPTRLTFSTTPDGTATLTERMRIDNAGQITTGLGSATAPVLSFTGDTNTGIYSPGADQVGIATAGTAAVVVDASQRVGIGTTPVTKLHVADSAQVNAFLDTSVDSVLGTYLIMRKSRGSAASPTAVNSGDVLGRIGVRGYGTSQWGTNEVVFLVAESEEAFTNTAQGSRLRIGTTAIGASSPTERMRIDNAGLITGTGTSLGAWTAYTPTLGGFTLGDGTWSAAYMRIGKVCVFRAVLTFGSTTTAASAFPTFTLPVTAAGTTNIAMNAQFFDTSASAYYTATSRQSSTTVVTMGILGASGVHTTCTTTTPFTWGVGDQIILSGTYEIA